MSEVNQKGLARAQQVYGGRATYARGLKTLGKKSIRLFLLLSPR